jgi:hypothetical protein
MPSNQSSRLVAIVVLVLAIFWPVSRIEAQGLTQPKIKPTTFRVAGTVVSAADGHPLARAHIFLVDTKNPQKRQWMVSSEDGHFEFIQVAKGKYSLEGAKRGFIAAGYNQHEQYSTAIVTGADVPTEDLILRLVPMAVLSVKILDESAEPLRKASVMLYREDRSSGVRRIIGRMSSSTDDLGSCEFTRLNPGTYFVGVTATPWYAIHSPSLRQDGQNNPFANEIRSYDVVYPPTYYGDTTEPSSATPITIKGGDQAQAEIHLSPVQSLHLVFHAAENGQRGIAMPSLQKLGFDGMELPQMTETQQVSPGLVEITGLAPGRYKISLPGSSPSEMDIADNGQDLSEAKGEALSTLKVSVRLLGEEKLPQPLYIQLHGTDVRITGAQAKLDEKGEASFTDVVPGEYNVFAGSFTKNYPVVKVSSQGGDTSSHSLIVPPGSSLNVSLSLTGGAAVNVEGFAKHLGKAAPGAMVVLVPKNPESNRELFRRDQSDLDGSFNLQGITPGSYTVVAIDDGWDLDWALPVVIETYLKNGQTVTVSDQHGQSMQLPEPVEVQPHH